MAVRTVEVGQFKTTCSRCKSIFVYEFTDCKDYKSDGVTEYRVNCPNCTVQVRHDIKYYFKTLPKNYPSVP